MASWFYWAGTNIATTGTTQTILNRQLFEKCANILLIATLMKTSFLTDDCVSNHKNEWHKVSRRTKFCFILICSQVKAQTRCRVAILLWSIVIQNVMIFGFLVPWAFQRYIACMILHFAMIFTLMAIRCMSKFEVNLTAGVSLLPKEHSTQISAKVNLSERGFKKSC